MDAMRLIAVCFLCSLAFSQTAAALEPVRVNDIAWAVIGELGQRSPTNLGNNATFGVIITRDGIVLIDAGATTKGAEALDAALKKISDLPVVAVINTGGQDHRWLGNGHWKAKGARLISSRAAVADQKARFDMQWMGLKMLSGEAALAGTKPVYAEELFESAHELVIGGVKLKLMHTGRAHTPGDLFVSLPDHSVIFAGDIVYVDRMLAILETPVSGTLDWLKAFDAIAALKPKIVVPGHGRPTSLEGAKAATRDYLEFLRNSVKSVIDRNGTMIEAAKIDQKGFTHLAGATELAGRNAQATFAEMEFE